MSSSLSSFCQSDSAQAQLAKECKLLKADYEFDPQSSPADFVDQNEKKQKIVRNPEGKVEFIGFIILL